MRANLLTASIFDAAQSLEDCRQLGRDLETRLEESEDTLEAIRHGEIDAIVMCDATATHRVYTLDNEDRPYRMLIEQIQEGAVTLSADGTVFYCNQRLSEMLGMLQDQVIGRKLQPFLCLDDLSAFRQLIDTAQQGRASGEFTLQRSDSIQLPIYISLSRLQTDHGEPLLCGVLADLTQQKLHLRALSEANAQLVAESLQRKLVEEALRQSQKMEAVGQLTGGVAHDFNNVLLAILSNLDLAQRENSQPTVMRFLQNAQLAAERGAKLTDRLLSFARKQPLRREPCDLNRLIISFKDLLARSVGSIIEVKLTLIEDVWSVMADATQFEMALLNLVMNSRDAMPEGGTLTITTNNIPAGSVELPSDLAAGDYTYVSVKDNGVGMDVKVSGKAFEPFYTTKEVGKGTGLGLSQVYGFSKQLGGGATLASTVGSGTTVGLFFPRATEAMTAIPLINIVHAESLRHLKKSVLRVLVVDDEPDVLDATADLVRALGFEVDAAESARRGLEVLSQARRVDLLISDFSMPEMNGTALIKKARTAYPDLPCLLVTGYAEISNFIDASLGNIPVLRKPYRIKQLDTTISELLAKAEQKRQH